VESNGVVERWSNGVAECCVEPIGTVLTAGTSFIAIGGPI
jgi:hypothetical protein